MVCVFPTDRISRFAVYPLRYNLPALRDRGYHVCLKQSMDGFTASADECDILCLSSKLFRKMWDIPETVFAKLESLRRFARKIVWFDDSDGTGITHFELLPYVDRYLKKQLLADLADYRKEYYGDRVFTDFYHSRFGITDEFLPYHSKPLDMSYADKVGLSWHIGLGDMQGDILPGWLNRIRWCLPPKYSFAFTCPGTGSRNYDFMFRGTRKYDRPTVSFHRERIGEILDRIDRPKISSGRVSIRRYRQDIRDSKVVVSPFGWGELGVRDFECWLYGACLVKPDMSHMQTWPDIFIPGRTYVPFKWDFTDLEEVVTELADDDETRVAIAGQGQDAYRASISPAGMERFCDWFIRQVDEYEQ